MNTPMHKRLILAGIALGVLLLFQNCSQPNKFESVPAANSSQGDRQLSGGEGYGGKLYELVSPSKPCPDKATPPSQIRTNDSAAAFLTIRDCRELTNPEAITVEFMNTERSVLTYNGQTYRDENSNAPFALNADPFMTLEIEDMPTLPTSGGGPDGNYLVITDNEAASQDVNFASGGSYYFTVRAFGESDFDDENAIVELSVDGVVIGFAMTTSMAAEYTFRAFVPAGTREVAVAFTNDSWNASTRQGIDLFVDWLAISRAR